MIRVEYLKNCPEHVKTIVDWFYAKRWSGKWSVDEVVKKYEILLNEDKLPLALIAFLNDKPAATAIIFKQSLEIGLNVSPWVEGLFVKSKYRKSEIIKAMVSRIEDIVKKMNYNELYLSSSSERLFVDMGYNVMFMLDSGDKLLTRKFI